MAENESKKDVKTGEKSGVGKKADMGQKGPISERQRFSYIGFEVYPRKPKDLFKSDQEKISWIERAVARRERGDIVREGNTLMEQRVSATERMVLAIASVILLASLFLPWYSAYTVIEEEAAAPIAVVTDSLATDSLPPTDSLADTAALAAVSGETGGEETGSDEPVTDSAAVASIQLPESNVGNEEIITSQIARKKVHREFSHLTWLGSIASFGSISGYVFSSGGVLIISGILMLVFMLVTIALPIFNLYLLFGTGKTGDDLAVHIKRMLRLNWLPLVLIGVIMFLSFFGSEYGFDAATVYDSLSDSYSIGTFMNTLSWGPFAVIAASMLIAAKGAEI
jgi:hypothetical protein